MHQLPQSLRPVHAAQILGISKATLLRWEQRFPHFPKPRRITARCTVYDRDELIAFRDSCRHGKGDLA